FKSTGALAATHPTNAAIGWRTSTRLRRDSGHENSGRDGPRPDRADGHARSSTFVAALVDTNILVYRFDPRFPEKQARATDLLRTGVAEESIRVPHQALVEFIAATTKPLTRRGASLLSPDDARRELEEMLVQFEVLYPDEELVRVAIRGAATYRLSWFDAHM